MYAVTVLLVMTITEKVRRVVEENKFVRVDQTL